MAKTKDEAMAFVHVLTKGPPAIHLEAILGCGNVPTTADFASDLPEAISRCEDFCALVEENLGCLEGLIAAQKAKFEKRKAEAKKNTIPGIPSDVEFEETLVAERGKMRGKK